MTEVVPLSAVPLLWPWIQLSPVNCVKAVAELVLFPKSQGKLLGMKLISQVAVPEELGPPSVLNR